MAREPQTGGLDVIDRDNNNTTDPKANQTNPWFDRPKPVDKSARAPVRDAKKVTGVPQDK